MTFGRDQAPAPDQPTAPTAAPRPGEPGTTDASAVAKELPPSRRSGTRRWHVLAWATAYLLIAGVLQFHFVSVPFDADTAYHVAVGRLIREHGILHAFPWTPFSWLADHYADKELLFHLLFVPFAGLSWIAAAKIVGTLLGGALLLALYLVLRAEGVPFAGIWALLPLVVSDVFLFRFALARPHLMSIALALIVTWAAARGRLLVLAFAALLYPWAYVAWHLPLFLVAVAEVARLLSGDRLRWKPAATAVAGTGLGLILHPNGVNLVRLTWIQIVDVLLRNAWGAHQGFDLGREFAPFTPGQWGRWLLACVALAMFALALAWRDRRNGSTSLAFALAALSFGLVTVRTARFAEYFIPFSAAAAALAARSIRWRFTWVVALGACALYSVVPISETLEGLGTRHDLVPPPLASWLQQRIPPGSQVFTCEWGLTGRLMLALPDRRFVVALDPTFFYAKDPELYRLWYRLPREAPAGSAEQIRNSFGARFVICRDDQFRRFYHRLASEAGVQTLLVSDDWMVYRLDEPPR
jgi:hypothetical protein